MGSDNVVCTALYLAAVLACAQKSAPVVKEMNIGNYTAGNHFSIESLFLGCKLPVTFTCNNMCDVQSISKQVLPSVPPPTPTRTHS